MTNVRQPSAAEGSKVNWQQYSVVNALKRAEAERLERLDALSKQDELLSQQAENADKLSAQQRSQLAREISGNAREMMKVAEEIKELLGWIYKGKRPLRARLDAAYQLLDAGWPEEKVEELLFTGPRRKRGRPSTRRQIAIWALETQLISPHLTWPQLAKQFCQCGERRHTTACAKNIDTAVGELKKVLRKYGLDSLLTPKVKSNRQLAKKV